MYIFTRTFNWAGDLYQQWFGDWLHIHFLIRTVLLLVMLWLVIYIAAQLIRYVIAPVLLMFFYHVLFRVWNFIAVESLHEWLYIRYHSKDKPNFNKLYLRLCDKVKKNRLILNHAKYKGMVWRSKRLTTRLMVFCGVVATLWVVAFGLHLEFADTYEPAMVISNETTAESENEESDNDYDGHTYDEYESNGYTAEYSPESPLITQPPAAPPTPPPPPTWLDYYTPGAEIILVLNETGREGSRLRSGPGVANYTVLEILFDNDRLMYMRAYTPCAYEDGEFWLRVLSPSGTVGYISSVLVDVQ